MKLPSSLTGPSNRGDDAPESRPWRTHGCLPGIIVIGWLIYMIIPLIGNELGFVVVFASPLGFTPVLEAMGLPKSLAMVGGIGVFVVLLSLPLFSFLASRVSVTVVCTAGVIVLLLAHMSGCRKISSEMSKITWNRSQAQRACVMQPRVRRTLGIESPHISISLNPNGVPSVSTDYESRASKVAISLREMSWGHGRLIGSQDSEIVHACGSLPLISTERDGHHASPDRRWQDLKPGQTTPESAGGPAHSRTLTRAFTLPVS